MSNTESCECCNGVRILKAFDSLITEDNFEQEVLGIVEIK